VSWVEPDPGSASILYAGVARGIVRSDDGGETWRLILSGGDSLVIAAPSDSPRLYATTPEALFSSTDGGEAWDLVLPGGGSPLVAPSSPSTLYASTSEGLFRSGDGGESWTRRTGEVVAAPSSSEYHVSDPFLVAADDPDIIFAMGGSSAVDDYPRWLFRSSDGGDTWSLVLGGDTPPEEREHDFVGSVVADPENPSVMYAERQMKPPEAFDFSNVLLKSTDGGATWTVVSPDEWVADCTMIAGITVDPRVPSTVYVLRYLSPLSTNGVSPLLVRSLDGGITWEEVEVPPSRWGNLPLFDPRSAGTLYIGGSDYGLYRSVDGGTTWQNITGELSVAQRIDFIIDAAPGGGVYAAADSGLYRWVPDQR
jgi:photosystem II stability/assembly factor-like uncharacterized protein